MPPEFRFSVKMPREITHQRKLVDIEEPLQRFLTEVRALQHTLGPLLIQLPPSLQFEVASVDKFLQTLRSSFDGNVVCEPRHGSWFTAPVASLLRYWRIARAAVDPAPVPQAAEPGGWADLVYRRLHGFPRVYYSPYSAETLATTAQLISTSAVENWCIFDNTALGEATGNALELQRSLL